jgi:FixJ family two-component response regulator
MSGMSGLDVLTGLLLSGISMPVVFIHEPEHNDIAEQAECLGANVCICSTANACAVVDALTAAVLQHSFARCRSFLSAFAA